MLDLVIEPARACDRQLECSRSRSPGAAIATGEPSAPSASRDWRSDSSLVMMSARAASTSCCARSTSSAVPWPNCCRVWREHQPLEGGAKANPIQLGDPDRGERGEHRVDQRHGDRAAAVLEGQPRDLDVPVRRAQP